MVIVTVGLSEKSNDKIRDYMYKNRVTSKAKAINQILEDIVLIPNEGDVNGTTE